MRVRQSSRCRHPRRCLTPDEPHPIDSDSVEPCSDLGGASRSYGELSERGQRDDSRLARSPMNEPITDGRPGAAPTSSGVSLKARRCPMPRTAPSRAGPAVCIARAIQNGQYCPWRSSLRRFRSHNEGVAMSVTLETVQARKLAAVRREVAPGPVGAASGPAIARSGISFADRRGCGRAATTSSCLPDAKTSQRSSTVRLRRRGHSHFSTFGEVYTTQTPAASHGVRPPRRVQPADNAYLAMADRSRRTTANRPGAHGRSTEINA